MTTHYTRTRRVQDRIDAERRAREYVRLVGHYVSPCHIPSVDGSSVTVHIDYVLTAVTFQPKSRCPKWLAERIYGLRYAVQEHKNGHESYADSERQAYSIIAEIVFERRWNDGFVQSYLPF